MDLFKNGLLTLVMAIVGWALIGFGLQWIGIIIYAITFVASFLILKGEYKSSGTNLSGFIKAKINDVFSKNIITKGAHFIVIAIVPFVIYSFGYQIYIDFTLTAIDNAFDALDF